MGQLPFRDNWYGMVWTMVLWARIQYAVSDGVQELHDGIGMAVL
jgi:hypothetical protein